MLGLLRQFLDFLGVFKNDPHGVTHYSISKVWKASLNKFKNNRMLIGLFWIIYNSQRVCASRPNACNTTIVLVTLPFWWVSFCVLRPPYSLDMNPFEFSSSVRQFGTLKNMRTAVTAELEVISLSALLWGIEISSPPPCGIRENYFEWDNIICYYFEWKYF